MYDSNLFAALFDVIEPRYRASSVGIMLGFAFIVGSSAPVLFCWIKTVYSLGWGISFLSFFFVAGGILIFLASRYFIHHDFIAEYPETRNE